MKELRLSRILLVLFAFAMLASCGAAKPEAKSTPLYPPDFEKFPSAILIIPSDAKMIDRPTKKAFEKYYTGDYIILGDNDYAFNKDSKTYYITNASYSNTKKYRYVVYCSSVDGYSAYMAQTTGNGGGYWFTFHMIDRDTRQNYVSRTYGGIKGLADGYVKKLEAVRAK